MTRSSPYESATYAGFKGVVEASSGLLDRYGFKNFVGPTSAKDKAGGGVHHFSPGTIAAFMERIQLLGIDFERSGFIDLGCGFGYLLSAFRNVVKGKVHGVDLKNVTQTLIDNVIIIRRSHEDFFKGIQIKSGDLTVPKSYSIDYDINIVAAIVGGTEDVNNNVVTKIQECPNVEILIIMGQTKTQAQRLGYLGFSHARQFKCIFAGNSRNGRTVDMYHRTTEQKYLLTMRQVLLIATCPFLNDLA